MTTILLILAAALAIGAFHVWNEVRVFRRGGDVYEWTKRLNHWISERFSK